jgi:hypothetical protein
MLLEKVIANPVPPRTPIVTFITFDLDWSKVVSHLVLAESARSVVESMATFGLALVGR